MMAQAVNRKLRSVPVYDGPIFDGDSHIHEPDDIWDRIVPKSLWPDWRIVLKAGEDGEFAHYIGPRKVDVSAGYVNPDGLVPPPGRLHEWLRAMKDGKSNVDGMVPQTPDMVDRDARIAKLDEFGVESSLLFPGTFISMIGFLDETGPANQILHGYNEWLADAWGLNHRNRVYTTAILNQFDLDASVKEAEWAVRNGARIVTMPMGAYNGKAPADPYYDRFWSVLNEAKIAVAFHVSEAMHMHEYLKVWGERPLTSRQRQTAWIWMNAYSERPVIETLSSFVFYNFFERYPNIKLVSVENGAEWVPGMLTKMDKVRGMAKNGYWPGGQLKQRPSAIFRENVFVVAYPEDDVAEIVQKAGGSQFLLMGSDYPHAEGVPTPRDFIHEALGGLPETVAADIMYRNGRRFLPLT